MKHWANLLLLVLLVWAAIGIMLLVSMATRGAQQIGGAL